MYDTIDMRIPITEQKFSVDLIATALYKPKVKIDAESQQSEVSGYLQGVNNCDLKVWANNDVLILNKRSICKWLFGDNLQQPTRKDINTAFEMIGKMLQVDVYSAIVTRFDIGVNIPVSKDTKQYLSRFGTLHNKMPIRNDNSLLYRCNGGELYVYDKLREMHAKREYIPPLWELSNVLRCEQRYIKPKAFFHRDIRCKDLIEHDFYFNRVQTLKNELRSIMKQEMNIDTSNIFANGWKGLKRVGVMALIERFGGIDNILHAIDEYYKDKPSKKKEKHDVKANVISCYNGEGVTMQADEVTNEINELIEQINIFAE